MKLRGQRPQSGSTNPGGGPAEDERLNASERPLSRSVIPQPAKGADRPEPKRACGSDRRLEASTTVAPGPPPDYRAQPPHPPLHIGQQGKPHSSRRCKATVFRPQGRRRRRGSRMPEKAKAVPCNGGGRAARAGIPSPKGRRLPAGLSGAMRLDASTDGDVRRRKLNRPKDGCRKPLVRRNQDWMLRAAGDLFPTAEA